MTTKEVKKKLSSKFNMKDLDATNFILGMEIKRDQVVRNIWLNQRKYIETILKHFNMHDCKPVKVPILMGEKLIVEQCPKTQEEIEDMTCVPYASVVCSMMYVMVYTQPDISHAVGVLRRYMSTPGKEHWKIVKRVSGICVVKKIILYSTKGNLKLEMKYKYMALSMSTGWRSRSMNFDQWTCVRICSV
jgi:hypothetical protein